MRKRHGGRFVTQQIPLGDLRKVRTVGQVVRVFTEAHRGDRRRHRSGLHRARAVRRGIGSDARRRDAHLYGHITGRRGRGKANATGRILRLVTERKTRCCMKTTDDRRRAVDPCRVRVAGITLHAVARDRRRCIVQANGSRRRDGRGGPETTRIRHQRQRVAGVVRTRRDADNMVIGTGHARAVDDGRVERDRARTAKLGRVRSRREDQEF